MNEQEKLAFEEFKELRSYTEGKDWVPVTPEEWFLAGAKYARGKQEAVALNREYIKTLIGALEDNSDPVSIDAADEFRRLLTSAPAVAINDHAMNWKLLDAHAQSGRTILLANFELESMRDDNNVPFVFSDYWHQYRDNGCWESWNELFDEQPTHYCEIAATEPPAAAINEQLLNTLKMVMEDLQSLEGRPRTFECVTEAIAAAEALKQKSNQTNTN